MVKLSGHIERRGKGWVAVVEIPTAYRSVVGAKRIKKGLGTRDQGTAEARLKSTLLAIHTRLENALKPAPDRPVADAVLAEAIALREALKAVQEGHGAVYSRETVWDPETGRHEPVEVEIAGDVIRDTIQTRAEALRAREGEERAQTFQDLALDQATPLDLHVETWLAEPGTRGKPREERTKLECRGIVKALEAWLAKESIGTTVEAVTRKAAGGFVSSLHADKKSPARIRDVCAALSTYWAWMSRRGIIPEGVNPWKGQAGQVVSRSPALSSAEDDDTDNLRPFTEEEMRKLFKGLEGAPEGSQDAALRDLMLLAALSGMRIEEACSLTVGQCAGDVFDVRGTKTRAARRKVPIHPGLREMIGRRTEGKDPGAWLLPEAGEANEYGKRAPNMSARFYRYRMKEKVDDRPRGSRVSRVNFHSFRRWFVSEAVKAGQPLHVLRQVVGHEQPKNDVTLGTYFKGDLEEAKRACVGAVRRPKSL